MNNQIDELLYCDNLADSKYCKENYWERSEVISTHIENLIHQFKPALVMIENPFMSAKTANSNMALIMLRGMIVKTLRDAGCRVEGVTPSAARSYVNVKPNTKEQGFLNMQAMYPNAGLETFKKDNDKSDAIITAKNKGNPKNEVIVK
ncbi:MAG: hypothetical protein ACRCX8_20975 [Sarcina sp.]